MGRSSRGVIEPCSVTSGAHVVPSSSELPTLRAVITKQISVPSAAPYACSEGAIRAGVDQIPGEGGCRGDRPASDKTIMHANTASSPEGLSGSSCDHDESSSDALTTKSEPSVTPEMGPGERLTARQRTWELSCYTPASSRKAPVEYRVSHERCRRRRHGQSRIRAGQGRVAVAAASASSCPRTTKKPTCPSSCESSRTRARRRASEWSC